MLVGSLTALESQAAFLRGPALRAGGRTGAGSAAHMTAVLCWRGRCLAQGKNLQAGGRSWLQQKAGEWVRRNLARMSERHRAVMPDGDFLPGVGEKEGACFASPSELAKRQVYRMSRKEGGGASRWILWTKWVAVDMYGNLPYTCIRSKGGHHVDDRYRNTRKDSPVGAT